MVRNSGWQIPELIYFCRPNSRKPFLYRGVAEWSNAAVLKTVVPRGTGGSNPSSSAINPVPMCRVFCDKPSKMKVEVQKNR